MEKKAYRIDIHHHILPPEYLKSLAKVGITTAGNVGFPTWEPRDSLELMDRQGIATAITSISTPGIFFGDRVFTRDLARICNDFSAKLINKYPQRFGGFATLPLPDIEASLIELEYALDTLELDGVVLLSNINGKYLGDPEFEELFSELNRRRSVVFIHPHAPPNDKLPQLSFPTSVLEFVFDTTRAVANILHHGILKQFSNIRFILAHAGGTAPYLAWRITFGNKRLIKYLKNFFYDMAISATSYVLKTIMEVANPSKLLFGSDFPFVHERIVKEMIQGIGNYDDLDKEDCIAIERENALMLFPRFSYE
ncbi:MAG: amidohydrolase family protein [Promethearchaeota archaeon]